MTDNSTDARAGVIPTMRYHDAPAAITWLCKAFGFEERLVVPGENGTIRHAQLVFGNGMIMVGSSLDSPHDALVKPPGEMGGIGSQSAYIVVRDAEEHCARATEAGAEIVMELEEQGHGGKLYSCRDPEGHVWNFGTYDPWSDA